MKRTPIFLLLSAFAAIATMAGCVSSGVSTRARAASLPEFTGHRQTPVPEYRLGLGDVIEFRFFINSEFDETVTVRPDGRISLLRLGDVQAAGLTPSRLDSLVTERYARFVKEPEITIIVREFSGNQIYVLGEVETPGGYPIQRKMTLLQAVASAGGATDMAKLGNVMILRREYGEEVKAIKVNLKKSIRAKSVDDIREADLYLRPQDVVYVPKTLIANVATFMRQVYDGILPPVDLYLRAKLFYDN